jgi:hypothetical protein
MEVELIFQENAKLVKIGVLFIISILHVLKLHSYVLEARNVLAIIVLTQVAKIISNVFMIGKSAQIIIVLIVAL